MIRQTPAGGGAVQFPNHNGIETGVQVFNGDALTAGSAGLPVAAQVAIVDVAITGAVTFTAAICAGTESQVGTQVAGAARRAGAAA